MTKKLATIIRGKKLLVRVSVALIFSRRLHAVKTPAAEKCFNCRLNIICGNFFCFSLPPHTRHTNNAHNTNERSAAFTESVYMLDGSENKNTWMRIRVKPRLRPFSMTSIQSKSIRCRSILIWKRLFLCDYYLATVKIVISKHYISTHLSVMNSTVVCVYPIFTALICVRNGLLAAVVNVVLCHIHENMLKILPFEKKSSRYDQMRTQSFVPNFFHIHSFHFFWPVSLLLIIASL